MKAVYFDEHGDLDVLRYGDVPDPEPRPGEALIRVKAAGCNYNDIWARRGLEGMKLPLPHISGSDTVGVVEQAAAGDTEFRPGDEVIVHPVFSCRRCLACARNEEFWCPHMKIWGFTSGKLSGGFGELVAVPASSLIRKPSSLSWVDAATLPVVALSVWRMLVHRATVRHGDRVLVWGAGSGIGALAVQVVKLFGGHVIAVTRGDDRVAYARELGADEVIDRGKQDVAEEIKRATDKQGVDLVFEHSGKETWPISMRSLRPGGAIVLCGATSGYEAVTDLRYLWVRQLTIYGSHAGTKADTMEVVSRVVKGDLRPLRALVMPMREAAEAQTAMESGAYVGKIVLEP